MKSTLLRMGQAMGIGNGPQPRSYNLISGLPDVKVSPGAEELGKTWIRGKVWDKGLIEQFYALLHQASRPLIIFDIGAQTGGFTLLAKYLLESQWYAFEPIAEAVTELKRNLQLNQIHNVTVVPACVSHQSGSHSLQLPLDAHWGLASLSEKPERYHRWTTRIVPSIDLDSFVTQHHIPQVDFIKIDTEGWELYVLKGAQEVIARHRPVILMEYNRDNMHQCQVDPQQILNFLSQLGYHWERISHDDILCCP